MLTNYNNAVALNLTPAGGSGPERTVYGDSIGRRRLVMLQHPQQFAGQWAIAHGRSGAQLVRSLLAPGLPVIREPG